MKRIFKLILTVSISSMMIIVMNHHTTNAETLTPYVKFESIDSSKNIKMTFDASDNSNAIGNLEYSTDNNSYTPISTTTIESNVIYIRSNTTNTSISEAFKNINFNNDTKVSGNVLALLDFQHMDTCTTDTGCFFGLFQSTQHLVDASLLELTSFQLSDSMYSSMFAGSVDLVNGPTLNALTLSEECYSEMFEDCKSLKTSPTLPATTLATGCYYMMFKGCTALEIVPVLNATVGKESCYEGMFEGCTSLDIVESKDSTHTDPWSIPASFVEDDDWNNDMFSSSSACNELEEGNLVIGKIYYQKGTTTSSSTLTNNSKTSSNTTSNTASTTTPINSTSTYTAPNTCGD